jgi:hypothetical protein
MTDEEHQEPVRNWTQNPVLTLFPDIPKTDNSDKEKFISFKLKVIADSPNGAATYSKSVRLFDQGRPAQWLEVMHNLKEIWTQNSIEEPSDRIATIRTIVKGESCTVFESALDAIRIDPHDEFGPRLDPENEHVMHALDEVANSVFPARALDTQKIWMYRSMRKPKSLSIRHTAAALAKINNCLPLFPGGTMESKFTDAELVSLLEWSLPLAWTNKFDFDDYRPSEEPMSKLIAKCEAIERSEAMGKKPKAKVNNNNKNNKKTKIGTAATSAKKYERKNNRLFCRECGPNGSHATADCYKIKAKEKKAGIFKNSDSDRKPAARPANSKTIRSFKKEANMIAKKANGKKQLKILATAVKREQSKHAKAAKKPADDDDSMSDGSDVSMNIMDQRIPKKNKDSNKKRKKATLDEERAFLKQISREEKGEDSDDDYDAVKELIDLTESDNE